MRGAPPATRRTAAVPKFVVRLASLTYESASGVSTIVTNPAGVVTGVGPAGVDRLPAASNALTEYEWVLKGATGVSLYERALGARVASGVLPPSLKTS